jgi:parvulin-like peptidyl-prolyl isomerase
MNLRSPATVTVLALLAGAPTVLSTWARAESPKPAAPVAGNSATLDPTEQARRDQAVATFEGGRITLGELEDTLSQQNPFMRNRYRDPKALQELLGRLVRFELLAKEAERQQWGQRKPVQEAVAQNAVQTMMRVEFDEQRGADAVSQADIEAYYKAHIDDYVQPAMQRASHVLVATEAEAKELLAQAKTMDVRAFRQLARDKSIDTETKNQGGDLHYFDAQGNVRGENATLVPQPIAKAAFSLKNVGDTLPRPVKTERGYSLLKLTGARPALSRKLAEVSDTIRAKLWREHKEKAIDAFVTRLREQHKPELHPELIELIKLDAPSDPLPASPRPQATAPAMPGQAPGPDEETRLNAPPSVDAPH